MAQQSIFAYRPFGLHYVKWSKVKQQLQTKYRSMRNRSEIEFDMRFEIGSFVNSTLEYITASNLAALRSINDGK